MKIRSARIVWLLVPVVLAGCAARRYQSVPIVPDDSALKLESRTLADSGLKTFLEQNLGRPISPWPLVNWDLNALTLAAIYFNPQIEIARAQVEEAGAAAVTARERPNP